MTDPKDMTRLVERLRRASEQSSDCSRRMAEDKSLRQAGNPEGRTDLYSWPTPEQTLEGEALAAITTLLEEVGRYREALLRIERQDYEPVRCGVTQGESFTAAAALIARAALQGSVDRLNDERISE